MLAGLVDTVRHSLDESNFIITSFPLIILLPWYLKQHSHLFFLPAVNNQFILVNYYFFSSLSEFSYYPPNILHTIAKHPSILH